MCGMEKVLEIGKKIINNKGVQLGVFILGVFFSFFILDIRLRMLTYQYVNFYAWDALSPFLFTVSWIALFIMLLLLLPKKARRIIYSLLLIAFNILTLAQYIHIQVLDRFFGVYDLFLAGEGAGYFTSVLNVIDGNILWTLGLSLISYVAMLFLIKYQSEFTKGKIYYGVIILVGLSLFFIPRFVAIDSFGEKMLGNEALVAQNVRNSYEEFNNPSRNMALGGLYEKTFREIYLYIGDCFDNQKEEHYEEAVSYFENREQIPSENEMTGVFKDKNVIFVMLESIDSWLATEELMPTFHRLQEEGWNFTNRYAPSFGGGATFNTEFSVNTGMYSLNNGMAAYTFDQNTYPYSLPNMFKKDGYLVQSVHANNGSFYNRKGIHLSIGYTHHYSIRDEHLDIQENYFEDWVLAANDQIYRYIVPNTEDKFMTFVTTYTGHMPYGNDNNKCDTNPYHLAVEGDEALSCIRNLVRHTDEFLRILLERLEEDGILEDTVLVLFADHYTYAYPDIEKVYQEKGTEDANLLQKVPLVIWSKDIESKKITILMDSADILPTVANLFDLSSYDANHYLATDVFGTNHESFVYFPDESWYDGTLYYHGQPVENTDVSYIERMNERVLQKITINDDMLLGDYYRYYRH